MDVNLALPHTPPTFATAPVGEPVVFHFTAPASGHVSVQTCYGPHGSVMQRTSRLQGPGVDETKVGQSAAFYCVVGPERALQLGTQKMVLAYGLQAGQPYTLTVDTPQPGDGRTTEVFGQLSSGA